MGLEYVVNDPGVAGKTLSRPARPPFNPPRSLSCLRAHAVLSCLSGDSFDDSTDLNLGDTFGVGVTGLILAVVFAVLLLVFARFSGDGPLHDCCRNLMRANRDNGIPATGKPAAVFGQPLPGSNPLPTAAAVSSGPPHYQEPGSLQLPQATTTTATGTTAG